MAKFAVSGAVLAVLAGTWMTAAAAVGGEEVAPTPSFAPGSELTTIAAATGRGMGSRGGEAGSGGGRQGGGGARGGGHRGDFHRGGDHGRHHGHHGRHHGHHGHYFRPHLGFGLALGAPLWWGPGYYPYPYDAPYYYAPGYAVAYSEPGLVRYVERDPGYRYYCPEPAGFYPDLQTCPKAWLKVVPDGAPSTSPPPGYSAPPGRP